MSQEGERVSEIVEATALFCNQCSKDEGKWVGVFYCDNCKDTFDEAGKKIYCGTLLKTAGDHFCSLECRNAKEEEDD